MSSLQIYGIRHNGPASARAVVKALTVQSPDLILIEGPAEGNQLIESGIIADIKAPVAMLMYEVKKSHQASFLPLADFSPEWQAIKFALENKIPSAFIDLPMAYAQHPSHTNLPLGAQVDYFSVLAKLTGFSDEENWWEEVIEQKSETIEQFELIQSIFGMIREAYNDDDTLNQNEVREIYMRHQISEYKKQGYENIAIICGAFHSPKLEQLFDPKNTPIINEINQVQKKIKMQSLWIPWSYKRLTLDSGNNAGVHFPYWYHLLFHNKNEDIIFKFFSRAAEIFRKEKIDISVDHVIHAIQLNREWLKLKSLSFPDRNMLNQVLTTVFCQGDKKTVNKLAHKIWVGEIAGTVPENELLYPLRHDFNIQMKKCGLTKYIESRAAVVRRLDLRKDRHVLISTTLFKLKILDIDFGYIQEAAKSHYSSFAEEWTLQWFEEFEIDLSKAATYGHTLEQAATSFIEKQFAQSNDISALLKYLKLALGANLNDSINFLIEKILYASSKEIELIDIARNIPIFIHNWKYGTIKGFDLAVLFKLIINLKDKLKNNLIHLVNDKGAEEADPIWRILRAIDQSIPDLGDPNIEKEWNSALLFSYFHDRPAPVIDGYWCMRLFELEEIELPLVESKLHYTLSSDLLFEDKANWLKGFLSLGLSYLNQNAILLQVIDSWITSIPEEDYRSILPILRRTFNSFSESGKELLWKKIIAPKIESETVQEKIENKLDFIPLPKMLRALIFDTK